MADKALLMGVNRYKSITPLRGCINDVENMRRLLTENCGFEGDNVHVLTDRQVVKNRVTREMRQLFSGVGPGDRVVLHFAGHGSYTVDLDGDEEDDLRDELLCLYDMNWEDSNGYLTDDELRDWTQKLPEGVLLTVILDNCHSGTGTRQIRQPDRDIEEQKLPWVDVAATVARGMVTRGALRSAADVGAMVERVLEDEQQDEVIARFVQPPPEIVERAARAGGRRSILRSDAGEMNHVLLAACRSDQTAADARIDGTFNGAFTYHLCDLVRRSQGEVDYERLGDELHRNLQTGGFSQVPQFEPRTTVGNFLSKERRQERDKEEGEGTASVPAAVGGDTSLPEQVAAAADLGNQRLLLELLHKIVDLSTAARPAVAAGRAVANRAVVYVHGICRHDRGYSDMWWQSMSPFTPSLQPGALGGSRREVLWSHWVNPSRSPVAMPRDALGTAELSERLQDTLQDRLLLEMAAATPEGERGEMPAEAVAPRAVLGIPGVDCIDDFSRYLLNDQVRRSVLDEFHTVVRSLLNAGAEIEVISHSWGTVVAYEALLELDGAAAGNGRVRNWFTVGSALSIPEVKRRLRGNAAAAGRKPQIVARWTNLDARGDIVGGPLKGHPFDVDHDFLNLAPVGCGSFLGIVSPACAHSSYFSQANLTVNRGIFGRFIED